MSSAGTSAEFEFQSLGCIIFRLERMASGNCGPPRIVVRPDNATELLDQYGLFMLVEIKIEFQN